MLHLQMQQFKTARYMRSQGYTPLQEENNNFPYSKLKGTEICDLANK